MIIKIPHQIIDIISNYFTLPHTKHYEVTLFSSGIMTNKELLIKYCYFMTQTCHYEINYIPTKDHCGYLHYHPNGFCLLSPEDELFAYQLNTLFFLLFTYPFNIQDIRSIYSKTITVQINDTNLEPIKYVTPLTAEILTYHGYKKDKNYYKQYFQETLVVINEKLQIVDLPFYLKPFKNEAGILILSRFDILSFPISPIMFNYITTNLPEIFKRHNLKTTKILHNNDYQIFFVKSILQKVFS